MGQTESKAPAAPAAPVEPIDVEDYVGKVEQFSQMCKSCKDKDWADEEFESIYDFEDARSEGVPAKKMRRKVASSFAEYAVDSYAADIFRILVQEVRIRNPWRKTALDAAFLSKVLPESAKAEVRGVLQAVKDSKAQFEHYVSGVLNLRQIVDPASSGSPPTLIRNAGDWATAIRLINRSVELLENHTRPKLEQLQAMAKT